MGIFSTPTIITTAVSRTLLVKNKPDLIKDSIIGAVLTDSSISGSIIAELLGGFVARVDRFYRYGRDTYIRGLPSSTGYSNGSNEQGVKDLLDILHGEPVTITELLIDKPTDDALAWEYLQNNWDWDSATNIVHKVPPGIRFPPDPNTLMPTTYSVSSNYMRFFFEYSYNNSTYIDQLDFNVPDNNTGTNYYMVEYYLDSDPTKKALFWNHRIDTSTLPEFNYEREMPDTKYPYYPIAILRHNKRDIDADVTTDEFITTNKLIGILGFEVTEVLDQVRENPESGKLDDVFLLFSLDVQSKEQGSIEYFYNYFLKYSKLLNTSKDKWEDFISSPKGKSLPRNYLTITEGSFGGYDITVGWNYIDVVENIQGTLENRFESENEILPRTQIGSTGAFGITFHAERSSIFFRRRTSSNTYTEVRVQGLYTDHNVHRKDRVVANLENSLEQEGSLSIPVEFNVLNESFSNLNESYTLYDSLNLSIYAIQKDETKWYESEDFLLFVKIVVIVAMVLSFQWQAIPAALAAMGTIELIITIAVYIAVSIAIKYALEFVAEEIGGEAALILGAVIAIASIAGGGLGGIDGLFSLPFADAFLLASTHLITAANTVILEEHKDLAAEQAAYLQDAEEKAEILEEAIDLLNTTNIDFALVTRGKPFFNPDESFDTFFERTVGETNPGVLSLDMVDLFVDNALVLPGTFNLLNTSGVMSSG